MKKFVLTLDLQDNKEKRKALKTVSALTGIDEVTVDMKGKKLIIIGTVDPVAVATKLRKFWQTNIILVGPAKEPEKKEEPKKEEAKKEEPKKEEAKQEPKKEEAKEEPKKEEPKKEEPQKEEAKAEPKKEEPKQEAAKAEPPPKKEEEKKPEPENVVGMVMPYRPYYPPMQTYYYMHHSIEENPNACVIS